MEIEILKAKMTGVVPLLMKNGRAGDPSNEWAIRMKAITDAMKGTPSLELALELERVKWEASIYHNGAEPVIPADNVLAMIISGSKLLRLGPKVKAGVSTLAQEFPLLYKGPRSIEELWASGAFADRRMVRINRAPIVQVRPRFNSWALEIELYVQTKIIDLKKVLTCLTKAGEQCGICDYRPRFGRFVVE